MRWPLCQAFAAALIFSPVHSAAPLCSLLKPPLLRIQHWLGDEVLDQLQLEEAPCAMLFDVVQFVIEQLHYHLNKYRWRHQVRKEQYLEQVLESNLSMLLSFDTPRYKCQLMELRALAALVSEVEDFLTALSLLQAHRCFFAELRAMLARFAGAVAEAKLKHSQLSFQITWWGSFAKPGGTVTRDLQVVDDTVAALGDACELLDMKVLEGWEERKFEQASAPRLQDEGGAFSELSLLSRRMTAQKAGADVDSAGWYLDRGLLAGLIRLLPDGTSVGDLGAGGGHYSAFLNATALYAAHAFDGAANIAAISGGRVRHARLDQPGLSLGQRFDWVLCLEVAEHVPQELEGAFLDNLARHAVQGLILSWSLHAQVEFQDAGEEVHPNAKSSLAEVEELVAKRVSFQVDAEASARLRSVATLPWLKESVSVFRRPSE
eukprot:TRINITY_DN110581_c0_g1_i1.p1 TRINITY_DN110581_c0_g1~~TRINITY_DN110581_c0_g1_i1.p1  ORF type:complete len:433 (-),score=93.57 TRINITY_DN110581_c0_g1_i1:18-1316(-)